jgi:ABC-type phosphate transport system substrate-binding protein
MRPNVLIDIARERTYQDKKWGGPKHDDTNTRDDWLNIIANHLWRSTQDGTSEQFRKQMVRVAALAVAAIDSEDRRNED